MDDLTARPDLKAGEFITETLPEYGGGRQVTMYVPPQPAEAVVFSDDGQGFPKGGRFLESTDLPPDDRRRPRIDRRDAATA